ncbi:hypothetical protein HC928_03615 [bacterium]|nr:hypothetical protein [bacterium]
MNKKLISSIRKEFDWDAYVGEHHATKKTASAELRICCLRCDDYKFKLYINPDKGVFFCQKCNFNSKNFDVFDFVAETEGISRGQAMLRLMRDFASVTPDDIYDDVESYFNSDTQYSRTEAIKPLVALPSDLEPMLKARPDTQKYWDYLQCRGLTEQEILAVKFHCTTKKYSPVVDAKGKYRGNLANRVVVPIYGGSNQLVSWQGRTLDKSDTLKYLSAPDSEMGKTVWPYVPTSSKTAVLCEGIYDTLAVRRAGFPAYATFTKKISREQILRIKTWGVENVMLFWDKRDAGKEMIAAVSDLHMHFTKVFVPTYKNWPIELDAGNMLADSQGPDKIKGTLGDLVDTYDSLEFAKWQLQAQEWC